MRIRRNGVNFSDAELGDVSMMRSYLSCVWRRHPAARRMIERKGAGMDSSLRALLFVLYGCAFIAGFNENLMNMALVSIMHQFLIDAVVAQWLVTAYMITVTVVVACMAYLYRRFTLRTLFFAAAALNIAGSVMGMAAGNFLVLLLARIVQALGAGVFIPLMMNVIVDRVPHERLGGCLALGSSMITIGPATAPIVTGFLVSELSWSSVFVVSLGFGVLFAVVGWFAVRDARRPSAEVRFDALSALLMALGVTALSVGLAEVSSRPLAGVIALATAVLVLAGFAYRQARLPQPLVSLEPLRSRAFWPAAILVMVTMMTYFSLSVVTPLYFEQAAGMSASMAGLMLLLPVCAHAGAAIVSGRQLDRRGEWPLLPLGLAITLVGVAVMVAGAFLPSVPLVVGGVFLGYLGTGMLLSPSQTAGLRRLPLQLHSHGVSLMGMALQLAACLGPATYVGIMSTVVASAQAAGEGAVQASSQGFGAAMAVAAVICLCGLCVAIVYARRMRETPYGE